jgi:hypothetical protein
MLALELKDEASVLMDLTGFTFKGQAKQSYADVNPSFSFIITLRDQAAYPGMADMLISASATSAVGITKKSKFIYDIEMTDANGKTRRLLEGDIEMFPEVTK